MGDYKRYLELAEKWKNGSITTAEQQELDRWYAEQRVNPVEVPEYLAENEHMHEERLLKGIKARIAVENQAQAPIKRLRVRKWIAAAAVIIAITSAGIYYAANDRQQAVAPQVSLESIGPGSDRATLKLSNGKIVELEGQKEIADGIVSIKNTNGQLLYTSSHPAPGDGTDLPSGKQDAQNISREQSATGVLLNTMTTPKGGTYQLRLPDGTHVWLNAASSITYPTAFTGNKRTVKLIGEAYFIVSKDKSKPFTVETKDAPITVFGTEFNVNAYPDEPAMQTTLLEGSVKVADKKLEPGQAWINGQVKKVNTGAVVAWKNGLFQFEEADLYTVMRQLGRWYDIDISFEGKIPEEKFEGELKRNLNLAQIMKLLSYMDIHYRLEKNRNLIISGK